jgi:tetratricopeptide (TPR) repeat protein
MRILLAAIALFLEATGAAAAAEGGKQTTLLEPGKPIAREIAGGQVHSYEVNLAAGEYAHLLVYQRGIDVVVTLLGSDGKKLAEIDSTNGSWGPEEVSVIAETTGGYGLEVRCLEKEASPGLYQVEVDKPRISTARDVTQVAAQRSYSEGERLRVEEKAESLRRAIDKYEKALSLRREAGDRRQEALTLTAIGEVYGNLGERQTALGYYKTALALLRTIGDGGEVASVLNYLGDVYY